MPASEELLPLLGRRLAGLRKANPELGEVLDLQEQLIRERLTSARPPEAQPFPLPREQLAARVRNGMPLLHDQPAYIDINFAADLFSRLVNVLQQRPDAELQAGLTALVDAATNGRLEPQRLFGEAFVQHADHVSEIALQTGVDADLLTTVAAQSVAPLLCAYAERLMPPVQRLDDGSPEGAAWLRGYCPVCGGWPSLAELRGVELARFLRCAACGSGWRSQRLGCPYCANDDYRSLQTLTIDGEKRFRISVCERCKGYLKVGNAFDPPPPELLVLDDVASLHLDVVAIERGYHRPVGTGYFIELAVPEDEWVEELA
jgi:FdhE protein